MFTVNYIMYRGWAQGVPQNRFIFHFELASVYKAAEPIDWLINIKMNLIKMKCDMKKTICCICKVSCHDWLRNFKPSQFLHLVPRVSRVAVNHTNAFIYIWDTLQSMETRLGNCCLVWDHGSCEDPADTGWWDHIHNAVWNTD